MIDGDQAEIRGHRFYVLYKQICNFEKIIAKISRRTTLRDRPSFKTRLSLDRTVLDYWKWYKIDIIRDIETVLVSKTVSIDFCEK